MVVKSKKNFSKKKNNEKGNLNNSFLINTWHIKHYYLKNQMAMAEIIADGLNEQSGTGFKR